MVKYKWYLSGTNDTLIARDDIFKWYIRRSLCDKDWWSTYQIRVANRPLTSRASYVPLKWGAHSTLWFLGDDMFKWCGGRPQCDKGWCFLRAHPLICLGTISHFPSVTPSSTPPPPSPAHSHLTTGPSSRSQEGQDKSHLSARISTWVVEHRRHLRMAHRQNGGPPRTNDD